MDRTLRRTGYCVGIQMAKTPAITRKTEFEARWRAQHPADIVQRRLALFTARHPSILIAHTRPLFRAMRTVRLQNRCSVLPVLVYTCPATAHPVDATARGHDAQRLGTPSDGLR